MWQKMLQTGSGGSSSFQFSTKEQKTNLKWIDGEDIYCKTFEGTTPSANNGIMFSISSLGIDSFVCIDGWVLDGEGNYLGIFSHYTSTSYNSVYISASKQNVHYYGTSFNKAFKVTIFYTKS